jgi:hypothetical protein
VNAQAPRRALVLPEPKKNDGKVLKFCKTIANSRRELREMLSEMLTSLKRH